MATHSSVVFLAGDRAYKVKKPVKLAFLDYSTLARRRQACCEELRVNRSLAPRIYLAVRAICPAPGGYELRDEGAPGAVEYAVEMVRFAEADTMAGTIAAGGLSPEQVREVGRVLAGFHREAAVVPGGGPEQVLSMWRGNLAELAALAGSKGLAAAESMGPDWRGAAQRFGEAFVAAHAHEMAQRVRDGHVRDGHGDIRCEHVLLAPSVQIVDRIEFDPALRQGDVAGDIAFLSMDLQLRRQSRVARELVAAYRHAGGSPGSDELRCFYGAHRALVRAKVALLSAEQGRAPQGRAGRLGGGSCCGRRGSQRAALVEAGRLVELSTRLAWCARRPVAIVLCGPPASGKSTLAAQLARVTGLRVSASDVVRKHLAGIAPTERGQARLYTAEFTHATYDELSRRVLLDVRAHGGAILDATCRTRGQRALIVRRLRSSGCTLLFVHCEVPVKVALERAAARMSAERVSDATLKVVSDQHRDFQSLTELAPESVLRLDATLPIAAQLRAVAAAADLALSARFSALPPRSGAFTRSRERSGRLA